MRNHTKLLLFTLLIILLPTSKLILGAAPGSDTAGISVRRMAGTKPRLGFACELDTGPLQALISTPGLIADIKEMNADISLALIDLSRERAEVVQQLNQAGIPVIAWLALPRDEGYYMNAYNSGKAIARFSDFEKWSAKYNLKWEGVGLDIEPDFAEFGMLKNSSKLKLVSIILRRSVSLKRARQARKAREVYSGLIRQIEAQGLPVQTYQLSFVADERKVHSTLLDRVIGVVNARGTTEVMMLYTSFTHNFGSSLIWSYGPQSQAIVVGVTGGGADTLNAGFSPLSWKELSGDLIVASHFTNYIGIFSLEGCVAQGFIPGLKKFDWDQTVVLSRKSLDKVEHFRKGVQLALWIVTYLSFFVAGFILLLVWLFWRRHRHKIRSKLS
jgi:hypothetical protein